MKNLPSFLQKNNIRACLFDFDGTLVDTEVLHYESFTKALQTVGINYVSYEEHCRIYLGTGAKFILKTELEKNKKDLSKLDELCKLKKLTYQKLIHEKSVKTISGANEFLLYLKQNNYKIGIVSGGILKNIKKIIKINKLPDVFDVYITNEIIKKPKPDPEGFLLAAKNLNVKPENCIIFEDGLNGILAGKSAKMKTVAIGTYIKEEDFRKVDENVIFVNDYDNLDI